MLLRYSLMLVIPCLGMFFLSACDNREVIAYQQQVDELSKRDFDLERDKRGNPGEAQRANAAGYRSYESAA